MPLGRTRRAPTDLTRAQASREGAHQACSPPARSGADGQTDRRRQDSELATALAQAHWNFPAGFLPGFSSGHYALASCVFDMII